MKNNITNTFQSLLKVLTVSSLRPARCDGADPGGGLHVHLDGLNAENTFHCWLYSV